VRARAARRCPRVEQRGPRPPCAGRCWRPASPTRPTRGPASPPASTRGATPGRGPRCGPARCATSCPGRAWSASGTASVELRSLVGLLANADREVATQAVRAAANLPSIGVCDDPTWLAATVKPPEDEAVRARVEAERERLSQAAAQLQAGHYDAGQALADAALATADALGYAPLRAEARVQVGEAHERRATTRRRRPGSRPLTTWPQGQVTTSRGAHDDHADARRRQAPGAARGGAGVEPGRRGDRRPARRGGGPARGRPAQRLGQVLDASGDSRWRSRSAREALAIREAKLGLDHPDVAASLHNLGVASLQPRPARRRGDYFARALTIRRAVLGEEHPEVAATSYNWLGNTTIRAARPARRSRSIARRWRSARRRCRPSTPTSPARCRTSACASASSTTPRPRWSCTAARWRSARRRCHPSTPTSPRRGATSAISTRISVSHAEARAHFQEALRRWERSLGPNHPALAFALLGIGNSWLAEGDAAAAVAPIERALALRKAGEVDAAYLTATRFALARALWLADPASGRGRGRWPSSRSRSPRTTARSPPGWPSTRSPTTRSSTP
jgi:tetratricopeptide (TPR) repeat protein